MVPTSLHAIVLIRLRDMYLPPPLSYSDPYPIYIFPFIYTYIYIMLSEKQGGTTSFTIVRDIILYLVVIFSKLPTNIGKPFCTRDVLLYVHAHPPTCVLYIYLIYFYLPVS